MATHADNLHYGISIVDSTIDIDNLNNVDGINPESILSLLPIAHDLSAQCDGVTREFILDPTIKEGTENLVTIYLDGVRLTQAQNLGDDDYYLNPNNARFSLGNGLLPPPQGTTLIAIYTESRVI